MAVEAEAAAAVRAGHGLPYGPSWVDRLTELIDGLPAPAWAVYLVAYLVLATAVQPSTLRAFLGALALPIVIWGITRLLERFV